jgi:hypothetical protein
VFFYMVMSNPVEGREAEYNDWYDTKHIPEITALDGFETARRYRMSDVREGQTGFEGYRYVCIYELDGNAPLDALARLTAAREAGETTPTDAVARDPAPRGVLFERV